MVTINLSISLTAIEKKAEVITIIGGQGGRGSNNSSNQFNQFSPNQSNNTRSKRPTCQICGKLGHLAIDCYHKMDYAYQGKHLPTKLIVVATTSNACLAQEQPWLANSG